MGNTVIHGCSGCEGTAGIAGCPYHGPKATNMEPLIDLKFSEPVTVTHHPAIEMIRLFLEKYEKMERSERDIICKAILELCKTPPLYMAK